MSLGMGNRGSQSTRRTCSGFLWSSLWQQRKWMTIPSTQTQGRASWGQPWSAERSTDRRDGKTLVCYKGPLWRKHRFSTAKCNIRIIYLLLRCFPRVPGGSLTGYLGKSLESPFHFWGDWYSTERDGHRLYRHKMEAHWYQGLYLKIPEDGEVHGFFFLSSRHCLSGNASIGHAHQHLTWGRMAECKRIKREAWPQTL